MNTLTAANSIELREYGEDSFGYHMSDRSFAVCVVDGEPCHTHWDDGDERCCVCGERYDVKWGPGQYHPPAWLTELTEPCPECDGSGWDVADDPSNDCPHCIDGRPAVKVEVPCELVYEPPFNKGFLIGRGTVEHVLPVVHLPAGEAPEQDCVYIDVNGIPCLLMIGRGVVATLDCITATPGRYVVLVRMEQR